MTHEDYVSFEQAQILKELGFDWEVYFYYTGENAPEGQVWFTPFANSPKNANLKDHLYSAPTLAQAQKWLREKEIEVAVFSEFDGELRTGQWVWLMRKFNTHLFDTVFSKDENLNFDTYEQALSAGIDKAIELLKEN